MQIIIKTPQQLEEERTELIRKAIELLKKQSRSAQRYAIRLQWYMNKIEKLNKRLGD